MGKCNCFSGWFGDTCEFHCEKGWWGPNCNRRCEDEECDRFTDNIKIG